jgi:hypothetical protein
MGLLAQVTGWEQHGLAGLVIAALIAAFAYFYRDNAARYREIDNRHTSERAGWLAECRAERAELMAIHSKAWEESRADTRTYLAESTAATRSLDKAVRDLHIEIRTKRFTDSNDNTA